MQAICYHLGKSEAEVGAMDASEFARHVYFIGKFVDK